MAKLAGEQTAQPMLFKSGQWLSHKEQLVSSDVTGFIKKTFRWIIQQQEWMEEGSASTASPEKKWKKFCLYFTICLSDPKGPQTHKELLWAQRALCQCWDPPRVSPPSSPPSVAGSAPALPSSSAAAPPALGFPSALPVPSIPLATAAPQPPVQHIQLVLSPGWAVGKSSVLPMEGLRWISAMICHWEWPQSHKGHSSGVASPSVPLPLGQSQGALAPSLLMEKIIITPSE